MEKRYQEAQKELTFFPNPQSVAEFNQINQLTNVCCREEEAESAASLSSSNDSISTN
jgi:hypothetical protein